MDLINNRTREIAALALDGLYQRSRAISANTVNATTPGYQRKDVAFEDQIQEMIEREDLKEHIKVQNSQKIVENPVEALKKQDPAQIAFLRSSVDNGFSPEIIGDYSDPISADGNNVNLEAEMMDEAKTGTQYTILTNLMSRSFQGLQSVIKGQI